MSIYDYTVKAQDGSEVSLSDYRGKVVLVVNTATGCGFTPQYEDLERIYRAHREQGLEILDFPCNQFREQAPGSDEEIREFCTVKFGADFPQFSKVKVNGDEASPLFVELATQIPFEGFTGLKAPIMKAVSKEVDEEFGDKAYVKWNFTKFLVDREGNLVARFEPTDKMEKVEKAIEDLL